MARNILALKEMVLFPLMYPEIFGMPGATLRPASHGLL
jgi:hypothetical protein